MIGCLIFSGVLTFLFLAAVLTLIAILPQLISLKDIIVPVLGIIFGGSIGAFIANEARKTKENTIGVKRNDKEGN